MIVIIGGGIAGLAAGLACEQLVPDQSVLLLEQSPSLQPVGAGIVLWPNALSVLRDFGMTDDLLARHGRPAALGGVRTSGGRWLRRLPEAEMRRRIGPVMSFHRAELVNLLRSLLTRTEVCLGARVTRVDPVSGRVEWQEFGKERELTADVVIAADGLRSRTRSAHWPEGPISSGIVCARAVLELECADFVETWGRGEIGGHVPLRGGRTYVYAARHHSAAAMDFAWLRSWPGAWEVLASALEEVAALDPSRIHVDELAALPSVRPWVKGRVALVGDAAHGMLPFLGQGACQGIEDARAVAHSIARGDLDHYERSRRPHADRVRRLSQSASTTALADGWVARARDTVIPLIPNTLFIRQLASWAAPQTPWRKSLSARPGMID